MDRCDEVVCRTCADELTRVVLTWVSEDGTQARGRGDGGERELSVELLDEPRPGDAVLEHGGVALQRAPEEVR